MGKIDMNRMDYIQKGFPISTIHIILLAILLTLLVVTRIITIFK